MGPPEPYTDEPGMYAALAALWKRGSIQLDRVCGANGIRYYHFLQPNQYFEGSKPMRESERAIAYQAELREMGIHFRDLTMVFVDHDETLYADDCCHYNQAGNDLMAKVIGQTIVADSPPP